MSGTTAIFRPPMPRPKSKGAPYFKGKHIKDFLEEFEEVATASGVEDKKLPKLVIRYCSESVADVIRHLDDLATGQDWDKAKEALLKLYKSRDQKPRATLEQLKSLTQKTSSSRFKIRRDLDDYVRKFMRIAGDLKERGQLTDTKRDLRFYQGLPSSVKDKIRSKLKSTDRNKPDSMTLVLDFVRALYDENDIDVLSDDDGEEHLDLTDTGSSAESDGGSSGTDSGSDGERARRKKRRTKKKAKSKTATTASEEQSRSAEKADPVAELASRMEQLSLAMAEMHQAQLAGSGRPGSMEGPKRCWMCDQIDAHRIGMRNCPETKKLVDEGLLKYSAEGRLVKVDNSELPLVRPGSGGIAGVIRWEGKGKGREIPPHMGTSASAMSVGIVSGGTDVISGDVYAVAALDGYTLYPAARSQKKEVRFDPIGNKDDLPTGIKLRISGKGQPPSVKVQHPPTPTSSSAPRPSTPKQTVPHIDESIREEVQTPGTKPKFPVKRPTRPATTANDGDVEMKDGYRGKGTSYRFTSDIQESLDVDLLQSRLLDTQITISLKELLASSPELQKRFQGLTRTHREYSAKVAEVEDCLIEDYLSKPDVDEESVSRAYVTVRDGEDISQVLEGYANAVSLKPSRLFAMTTGRFEARVGGVTLSCMIDTGSELNLMSASAFEALSVPLDTDGSRWSLKGVSGAPVGLQGCARDLDVMIGGHRFDHHFFISSEGSIGKQDIILGQPWLTWFSASIEYHRGGPMTMSIRPNGDDRGPIITLKLVSPDHRRNTDRLTHDHSDF